MTVDYFTGRELKAGIWHNWRPPSPYHSLLAKETIQLVHGLLSKDEWSVFERLMGVDIDGGLENLSAASLAELTHSAREKIASRLDDVLNVDDLRL